MGALNAAPVFCGFTLGNRLEAGSLSLRQFRQEFGQAQIVSFAQELQLDLRGFEHCSCALHREVQRLQAIDSEHVLGSSPNGIQPCDLQSATPIRTGHWPRHTNRKHDRVPPSGMEHASRCNTSDRPGRSERLAHAAERMVSGQTTFHCAALIERLPALRLISIERLMSHPSPGQLGPPSVRKVVIRPGWPRTFELAPATSL
jgi:hypothetical protein